MGTEGVLICYFDCPITGTAEITNYIQSFQFKLKKYQIREENKHSEMLNAYLLGTFRPHVKHREEKNDRQTEQTFFLRNT